MSNQRIHVEENQSNRKSSKQNLGQSDSRASRKPGMAIYGEESAGVGALGIEGNSELH
jgi:hypothetical protein